jgi:hypothetical protein
LPAAARIAAVLCALLLLAGIAAADEVRKAPDQPFAAESLGETDEAGVEVELVRPVDGRWWWWPIAPGLYEPLMIGGTQTVLEEPGPEDLAALERLASLPRPDTGYSPEYWCIIYHAIDAQGRTRGRMACMED